MGLQIWVELECKYCGKKFVVPRGIYEGTPTCPNCKNGSGKNNKEQESIDVHNGFRRDVHNKSYFSTEASKRRAQNSNADKTSVDDERRQVQKKPSIQHGNGESRDNGNSRPKETKTIGRRTKQKSGKDKDKKEGV